MSPRGRLFIALLSTTLIGYIAVGSLLGRVMGDSTYGQLAVFNEVVRLVLEAYVEPVNLDRAMAGARLGLTEALDGDSSYLDAEEFRTYQQPGREGEGDVGVVLSRRFSFLMVVAARPGSPAEKAGVKPGDIIKTIDGRHSRPLAPVVGARLLRGAPGSVVKLTLLRAGADPIDVTVVRERLAGTPPSSKVLDDGSGYLKVPEMPARVAEDVRSELESLKKGGAKRLVLDLRGSGYGVPAEGVKVAELFMKGGTVAKYTANRASEETLTASPARFVWDLPVAVLVDTGTAGASEIVAAALLENGRAPVVGEHTFGRAGVQKSVSLAEGGLVLTVGKYVSPKGNAIHGRGIEPSVPVEAPDETEPGEAPAGDPILDKALEVLKTEANKAA
jgi:carboxyl-terminal processing protease